MCLCCEVYGGTLSPGVYRSMKRCTVNLNNQRPKKFRKFKSTNRLKRFPTNEEIFISFAHLLRFKDPSQSCLISS
jgi:hypothetical protein